MTAQPAIEAHGLVKRFGPGLALAGVDLEVPAGSVVGLLGPNGAGKTTAVRILSTLLRPDAGRAFVLGRDVVREPGAVRRMIGLSGQFAAASLVAEPAVLFLDEPTTGLDPRGRLGLWQLIGRLSADGASVLLTTQYLEEADRLADRIVVLDHGRVIATGTAAALKARVGGDRIELRVSSGADPHALAAAVGDLGSAPATVDSGDGRVVLPVADGPAILPELAARLATTGLRVSDLTLRRPTLDEVFLTLTGQSAPDHVGIGA